MTTANLTETDLFPMRLLAYSNERFPAVQVVGQFPMFLVAFLFGQVIVGSEAAFTTNLFVGFLAFVAYTLMVRVIDDHKDVAHDNEHYPDRVLQRGLITFTQLKVIGIVSLAITVGGSIYIDGGFGPVVTWFLIIFLSNSTFQFILIRLGPIGAELESRRVLFALTVIPFWGAGAVWIAQIGAGGHDLSVEIWWLIALWCVSALLLEIARKSRTPEDDRPTVADYTKSTESWTRSLGLVGTVVVLSVLTVLATALTVAVIDTADAATWWTWTALGGSLLPLIAAGIRFGLGQTRFRAKDVAEVAVLVWMIGQLVAVAALLATN